MIRHGLLLVCVVGLSGCWSTYVSPNKPDVAEISIINDEPNISLILSTYKDGAECRGTQFFDIPKDQQHLGANMDSHLKGAGRFTINVEPEKPFYLQLDGIAPTIDGRPFKCSIKSTLLPNMNSVYEIHYDYSSKTDTCRAFVIEMDKDGNRIQTPLTHFKARQTRAQISNGGSGCIY